MAVHYQSKTDQWVKCISASGTIRAIAVQATDISKYLVNRHSIQTHTGKIALAESMVAALILSSYCKSGEKVNLNIKGSGWCNQAIIDANAEAEIRGYIVERPQSEVHLGKDIGPWGIGLFSVLRTKLDQAQPYIGTVPMLTGRIAKDLTFYWHQSEQVQSAVGIEILLDDDQNIALAEGFLVQALPGATEKDISMIEEHLRSFSEFTELAYERSNPVNVISYLLENQTFSILEEKPLTVKCECSEERVKRSLTLIGVDELKDMLDENKDVEVKCDFCSELYVFSPAKIEEILKSSRES